jgi:hypothetical protein
VNRRGSASCTSASSSSSALCCPPCLKSLRKMRSGLGLHPGVTRSFFLLLPSCPCPARPWLTARSAVLHHLTLSSNAIASRVCTFLLDPWRGCLVCGRGKNANGSLLLLCQLLKGILCAGLQEGPRPTRSGLGRNG